jgi:hypothetical protein
MVRQWRHLKMLKRSGYGHLYNTLEEEQHSSALLCPACPQPGINLPPDWEKAPKEKRFVMYIVVSHDCNLSQSTVGCIRSFLPLMGTLG